MNEPPMANRVHIGFFGRRNAGKSSLLNAITNQDLAVVSEIRGTTTDPVYKSMELLPLGPVTLIDTPGIDDEGALGELRVKKTRQILNKTEIAVLVVDAREGMKTADLELLQLIKEKKLPYLIAYNKKDLLSELPKSGEDECYVSALKKDNVEMFKERLAKIRPLEEEQPLVRDLVQTGDFVILVVPIDKAAPKGRLILPQQQVIRDLLEKGAYPVVTKEDGLADVLSRMGRSPRLVITDSQVFRLAERLTPQNIPLTSFSILFARYKGFLKQAVQGAECLLELQNGDRILISEGCTHHRQCNDIGTVKLPGMIREYCGKKLEFSFTSGGEFPEDLRPYRMIVHCGGCMLNEREMRYRQKCAGDQGVPMTNYGIAMAKMQGILERSLEIFRK